MKGAGGTQRLSRLVGPSKAKEMIFLGTVVNGQKACEIGLANFYSEKPFEKAIELAELISEKGPIAIRMAKKAINTGIQVDQ